ncbi:hypothetical protein BVG16_22050 [Paenibacillus selenitireducens]|uniref:Uncharacterized protein n=2 Tax=Paenibacillus selenitireducens TaxID=1324314 RepID=A0A1T2X607_9BACL|nr:hypothetical protein BVG16_22050 [Paenibacillus selenitireducens]
MVYSRRHLKKRIFFTTSLFLILITGFFMTYWIGLNSNYSQTPMEAIEKARGDNFLEHIVQQQPVSDGEVVFYLRPINNDQVVVSADYVRKTWRGWKWVTGGGHSGSGISLVKPDMSLGEPLSYQLIITRAEADFRVLFGVILDPDITRVVVKGDRSRIQTPVNMIELRDHLRFYDVVLPYNLEESIELEAFDSQGRSRFTTMIDNQSSGLKNATVLR